MPAAETSPNLSTRTMTRALGHGKKARSFSGCKCCKQAKRKCPEERPRCSICEKLGLKCEYDLNFLFRCEMVDFSGHISKADRITRPGAPKTQKRSVSPTASTSDHPTSPQKYIHYEFIDESASVMSPSYMSEERSPTPPTSSMRSPTLPFDLLVQAAGAEKSNPSSSQILTPPQSPNARSFSDDHRTISNGRLVSNSSNDRWPSRKTWFARIAGIYTQLGN